MSEQAGAAEILDDLHQQWSQGTRISVEELISKHGITSDQSDVVLDLIYAEILLREGLAERPAESEYCERFPDLQVEIARQFQIHRAVQNETVALTQSVGGTSRIDSGQFPNLKIPGFEIQKVVGRGACGVAFLAMDVVLNRPVAIKVLSGTVDDRQQLLNEAETIASLKHPGIVSVLQVGEIDGEPFLVMDYLDGGSLADRLRRAPLSVEKTVALSLRILEAVQHAHDHGIIHRDIKPGNILLDGDGNPHVADFGLARKLDGQQTLHATGSVVGTPAYMSPEQARGERANEQSDVYSIGAVLYEMLCGRPPFQAASPWEILNQLLTQDVLPIRQLNSAIPRDLETICATCLETETSRRYASAQQVHDELALFAAGKPIKSRPVSTFQRMQKWCRRNPGIAVMAALLLVSLSVGTIVSTVKMVESDRNAARAMEFADKLGASRIRMRESVERFQSRVFADETLCLHMNGTMRKELFDDVIAYLSEFEKLADKGEVASADDPIASSDSLTRQYLAVAEAALRVSNFEQSVEAATRAHRRMMALTTSDPTNGELWIQRSNAARILFLAKSRPLIDSGADSSMSETIGDFADEAIRTAKTATELEPDNVEFELEYLIARWEKLLPAASLQVGNAVDSHELIDSIGSIHDRLAILFERKERNLVTLRARLYQVRIGQFLLSQVVDDEEFAEQYKQYDGELTQLRENFRALSRPMSETQCMRAEMYLQKARRDWNNDRKDEAIDLAGRAEVFLRRAVEPNPNHRRWRKQLITGLVTLCEFRAANGDAESARESINQAILSSIHLLESDPRDFRTRQAVIRQLIRYAELSEAMSDSGGAYRGFKTASQDCRLFMDAPQSMMDWAFQVSQWTLMKAMESSPEDQRESELQGMQNVCDGYSKRGFDTTKFKEMIAGRGKVAKPTALVDLGGIDR